MSSSLTVIDTSLWLDISKDNLLEWKPSLDKSDLKALPPKVIFNISGSRGERIQVPSIVRDFLLSDKAMYLWTDLCMQDEDKNGWRTLPVKIFFEDKTISTVVAT